MRSVCAVVPSTLVTNQVRLSRAVTGAPVPGSLQVSVGDGVAAVAPSCCDDEVGVGGGGRRDRGGVQAQAAGRGRSWIPFDDASEMIPFRAFRSELSQVRWPGSGRVAPTK